jgi:hypothetical protein
MFLIITLLIYVKQERFQQEYLGVKSLLSTYQKERPWVFNDSGDLPPSTSEVRYSTIELLNSICNLAYRKSITKTTVREVPASQPHNFLNRHQYFLTV